MFSLLHFLASHPRNADTLKRALHGDTDARRLFSFLGVTPTHLESIDEGAIARRSAAVSVPRTVDRTAPASCADRLAEAEEAIRALRDRAESAEASVHELRQRLQAEIMAHDTTRSQVGKAPKPEQTPPEEVIVLGPWWEPSGGYDARFVLNGPLKSRNGLTHDPTARQWWILGADGEQGPKRTGEREDAETAARKTYALIDAEPGSLSGTISAWRSTHDRYHEAKWDNGFILIDDHSEGLWACPGWRIVVATPAHPKGTTIAEGPQTGKEGKRYALAAAHALGLTGGGE